MALEVDRGVFEEAQRVRKKRLLQRQMAGRCRVCWKRPRRPAERECLPCHAKLSRERRARDKRARRAAEKLIASLPRTRPLPGVNPAHDLDLQG